MSYCILICKDYLKTLVYTKQYLFFQVNNIRLNVLYILSFPQYMPSYDSK